MTDIRFKPTPHAGRAAALSCRLALGLVAVFCLPSTESHAEGRVADCPPGYTNVGGAIGFGEYPCMREASSYSAPSRTADCPPGYTNMGLYCGKGFSTKGAGSMVCRPGEFKKGVRCYQTCREGYTNIGEACLRPVGGVGYDKMTCRSNERFVHDDDRYPGSLFAGWCLPLAGGGSSHGGSANSGGGGGTGGTGTAVRFGQKVAIANGYGNWSRLLSECGPPLGCSSGELRHGVHTDSKSGQSPSTLWTIVSTAGKPAGAIINDGDGIYLENAYDKGYLDVCGAMTRPCDSYTYHVNTSVKPSTKWTIATRQAGPITYGEVVQFRNDYGSGGWLGTCGGSQCVSGNVAGIFPEREEGNHRTTHWRLTFPQ